MNAPMRHGGEDVVARPLGLEFLIPDGGLVVIGFDVVQEVGLFDPFHSEADEQDGKSGEREGERQRLRVEQELEQPVVKPRGTFFS